MSPSRRGRRLTSLVLLCIVCCTAVEGHDTHNGPRHQRPRFQPKDRTNNIRQMPVEGQKHLFNEILSGQGVELNGEVDDATSRHLPDIINSLAGGTIDILVSQIPLIGPLLGPLIKGGLRSLTNIFGEEKVYIPNMPPVITCPPNIEEMSDSGRRSAVVNWNPPRAFDAEDGQISHIHSSGVLPGTRVTGEEIVTYTVFDSEGRKDWCQFYIKVKVVKCRPAPLKTNMRNTCRGPTYYGNSCHFSCDEGYTLQGSDTLTCTRQGFFNYAAPSCKINTCAKPELPTGGEKWDCSDYYNYKSACTIKCKEGYRNIRTFDKAPWNVATIECKADGNWTSMPRCKDVAEPEISNCPGFTKKYADRSKNSTKVVWDAIIASDVGGNDVNVTQTKGLPSGSIFTAGSHEIEYIAVDAVGLTDTCRFFVNVEVRTCSLPANNDTYLDMDCPKGFSFGSACDMKCLNGITLQGSPRITCEKNGDQMQWNYPLGPSTCPVLPCYDPSDPPNARFECGDLTGRRMCSLKCLPEFIPARNEDAQAIFCSPARGVWTKTKHPGCVHKRAPKSVSSNILFYYKSSCTISDTPTQELTRLLSNRMFFRECPQCRIENMRSQCRVRRKGNLLSARWSISLDLQEGDNPQIRELKTKAVGLQLKDWIQKNFPTKLPHATGRNFRYKDTGTTVNCEAFTEMSPRTTACAACGAGYQFKPRTGCEPCPENTFQDDSQHKARCRPCPSGTQTVGTGATSREECKRPCPKGSVSRTTLTPCYKCPRGEYQDGEGKRRCKKCPEGQITADKASDNSSQCYVPPGKVQLLRSRATEDSITISWVRPRRINGVLIGYIIRYREDNEGKDKQSRKRIVNGNLTERATFENLMPNTTYSFNIQSVSDVGPGLDNIITDTTERKPDPTTTTTTTTVATTTATITTTGAPQRRGQTPTPDSNLCPPGTNSPDGRRFPDGQCQPCGRGFYQNETGQQECKLCPRGFTTWHTGSQSIGDCVDETWTTPTTTTTTTTMPRVRCPSGSISTTGFEPSCKTCPENKIPNRRQKKCIWCPRDGGNFVCSPQQIARVTTETPATTPEATTPSESPDTTTNNNIVLSPDVDNNTNITLERVPIS